MKRTFAVVIAVLFAVSPLYAAPRGARGLAKVCPRVSSFNSGILYKHPGSGHLPSWERNTLTLIFRRGDRRIPWSGSIYAYDSAGNKIARLGAKYPNGTYGKRYYTIPTGDRQTAQGVQGRAIRNTRKSIVYFKVNGTCVKAPRIVNVRLGGV